MSQVIKKLQDGGFFKYPSGEIEKERLIQAISLNLDDYLSHQDWSKKRKERFINSVDKFITGIRDGNITSMTEVGRFYDNRGIAGGGVSDETGKRFKEDKEAATFVKWVLNAQDPYKPVEKKTEPFDINKLFARELNKLLFNTDSDKLNYEQLALRSQDPNLKKQYLPTVYKALENIVTDNWGVFKNQENFKSAVEQIKQDAKNIKRFSEDLREPKGLLSRLGLDTSFLDYFRYNPKQKPKIPVQQPPEQDYYTKMLFQPSVINWWNQNKNQLTYLPSVSAQPEYVREQLNQIGNDNFVFNFLSKLGNISYNNYNQNVDSSFQMPFFDNNQWTPKPNTYAQLASNVLNYLISLNDTKHLVKTDDSKYAIMPTLQTHNGGTGLITLYNPSTKQLMQVPAGALLNDSQVGPKIKTTILPESTSYENSISIPWRKFGGNITKLQSGGAFNFDTFQDYNKIKWDADIYQQQLGANGNLSIQKRTNKTTNNIHPNDSDYDPELGGKEIENQDWWNNWRNTVKNNPEIQRRFAETYLTNNTVSGQRFEKRWFPNGKSGLFDNATFLQDFNKLSSDKINGPGHDIYKGTLYRVRGTNEYINPSDINEYDQQESYEINPFLKIIDVTKKENASTITNDESSKTPEKGNPENSKNETELKTGSVVSSNPFDGNKEKYPKSSWDRWVSLIGSTLGRAQLNNVANKKMLDEALAHYKPAYYDTKRFERNIYGDYASLSQGHDNASRLMSSVSKPISSDVGLQAARQLEAAKLANQELWKGNVANNAAIKQSTEAALAQAKQNMEWAVDTVNENRTRYIANEMLKSQARQGYIHKNAANWENALKELQQIYTQHRDTKAGIDQKAMYAYIEYNFNNNPKMLAEKDKLSEWIRNNPDKDYTTSEPYKELVKLSREFGINSTNYLLKSLSRIYGVPFSKNFIKQPLEPEKVLQPQKKSGGKLEEHSKLKIAKIKDSLEKQKLFYKNIQDSINNNSKAIDSLSNTMQKLIMRIVK